MSTLRKRAKSLISIEDLSLEDVEYILSHDDPYDISTLGVSYPNTFLLFSEPSTRTRASFELAAKQMYMDTVTLNPEESSMEKGESFKDTIRTLEQYEPTFFVIRHKNGIACQMASEISQAGIINAGTGTTNHPTQALADLKVLRHMYGEFLNLTAQQLKVGIVGDIVHSRVARSVTQLFTKMGIQVSHWGPVEFLPSHGMEFVDVKQHHDLYALEYANLDILYIIRPQTERFDADLFSRDEYINDWQISYKKLEKTNFPYIMHAGPVNRGLEVTSEVIDSDYSLVSHQVSAGLSVRRGVFMWAGKQLKYDL